MHLPLVFLCKCVYGFIVFFMYVTFTLFGHRGFVSEPYVLFSAEELGVSMFLSLCRMAVNSLLNIRHLNIRRESEQNN